MITRRTCITYVIILSLIIVIPQAPISYAVWGTIKVSGFNNPRNRGPFTMTGNFGGSDIIDALQNPDNFGPTGIVKCTVQLLPFVQTITTGSLVDAQGRLLVEVFLAGLTRTTLTNDEVLELEKFLNAGGILYISGNSGENEGESYNPLFSELGLADRFLGSVSSTGNGVPTSTPILTKVTDGQFGIVGPLTHSYFRDFQVDSLTGVALGYSSSVYILVEGTIGKGYISITGDPLYFNMFTASDSDNLNYFLNLVALGCTAMPNPVGGNLLPSPQVSLPIITLAAAICCLIIPAIERRKHR